MFSPARSPHSPLTRVLTTVNLSRQPIQSHIWNLWQLQNHIADHEKTNNA